MHFIRIKRNFKLLFLFSEIKCPHGQVYNECSTLCYHNCGDLQIIAENCTRDCVDGCRCPEGEALDENNRCIPIEICPKRKNTPFNCKPRDDRNVTNQNWYVLQI